MRSPNKFIDGWHVHRSRRMPKPVTRRNALVDKLEAEALRIANTPGAVSPSPKPLRAPPKDKEDDEDEKRKSRKAKGRKEDAEEREDEDENEEKALTAYRDDLKRRMLLLKLPNSQN